LSSAGFKHSTCDLFWLCPKQLIEIGNNESYEADVVTAEQWDVVLLKLLQFSEER